MACGIQCVNRTQLQFLIRDNTTRILVTTFGPLAESMVDLPPVESMLANELGRFILPAMAKDITGHQFMFTLGVTENIVKTGNLRYKVYSYLPLDDVDGSVPQDISATNKGKDLIASSPADSDPPSERQSLAPPVTPQNSAA
ncbi:hypothetical protein COLO4_19277 [Corchorus olitorius]|uniref:Nucleic acid-binding protein n=1 Tax=Corchorus olitorius TaxID=93759 RepID=A0A1R3J656_9ROSI|nr:hypothetical protein COLO4_19277 [Corchorus olitorius]